MSSEFGKLLRISVFGQSHGKAIGVIMDGLPAGEAVDLEELNAFLDRRKPGKRPTGQNDRSKTARTAGRRTHAKKSGTAENGSSSLKNVRSGEGSRFRRRRFFCPKFSHAS